ncbi:MAG TPA: hypothetical protein VF668_12780 [Pyrinomonadaceae bacterium]|jgi:hypothetical protein
MVFPIGDDDTGRATTPVVNYLLIAANVLVFFFLQGVGADDDRFTCARATAPAEVVTGRDAVTPDRVARVEPTNQRLRVHGLQPAPGGVLLFSIFTTVAACVALGLWFLSQFFSGPGMLGGGAREGGAACAAHVGRFVAGLAPVKRLFDTGRGAGGGPARAGACTEGGAVNGEQ